MVRPALANAFWLAGTGPIPMTRGATPAVALATMRAIGFNPCDDSAACDASNKAAAPSLIPDALPAVTDDPGPFTPGNFASFSSVTCSRGCSSRSTKFAGAARWSIGTGKISSANTPA